MLGYDMWPPWQRWFGTRVMVAVAMVGLSKVWSLEMSWRRERFWKKKKLDRWVGLWRWPDGSVGLNLMPLFPTLIQKLQFKKRSNISAFARHSRHPGKNGLPKSIHWRWKHRLGREISDGLVRERESLNFEIWERERESVCTAGERKGVRIA